MKFLGFIDCNDWLGVGGEIIYGIINDFVIYLVNYI